MKERLPFIILLSAVIIKLMSFYALTHVSHYYIVIVLITCIIYTGMLLLLKKPWLSFSLALVLSLIMEGEVLYFRYFNKLLSFSNISQAKFVESVSNILMGLIRPLDLILFIDVFVLLYICLKKKSFFKIKHKYITAAMVVAVIPFLTLSSYGNPAGQSIMNQEFFLYHVKDGVEVYLSGPEEIVEPVLEEAQEEVIEKEFTGLFKGKNLITIQVESLQDMMLLRDVDGQEITPFLNSLIENDSFYYSSYYQQLGRGNTSDSEFSSHNSLYPSMEGISYDRYRDTEFRGLPVLLKEEGYKTMAFHGNVASFWCRDVSYDNQGFDEFYSKEKLDDSHILGMGISDTSLFEQGLEILKDVEEPFYGFFVTLTNHNPYELPEDLISIDVGDLKGQFLGSYIESVNYTDRALEGFYNSLDQAGLLDNTVLIIYGDHHGIACMDDLYNKQVSDFIGHKYDFDEMMNIPLIIHSKGSGVSKQDDHVFDEQDLLPTLVNLFGIEADLKMMGQDMLNTEDYFALFQTYMVTGSFIQNDIVFEMSRDSVFENSRAYNRKTRQPVDLEACRPGYKRALYEIALSKFILENNNVLK
ncbi:LTA synthase family protein [Acidaminobacter sp. JC074]|uniref:LTA synthase family protein n=1 Tax=Acidaminobacter sp. JC074 TaxID=2530199 RepID=UPI001F0FA69E|nr:LTA synthase family protein [Acidaminobacter sp. JC074]MCH4890343.1 LTA synthase family protein [Acidaminobacter sp. JC074]